MRQTTLLFLSGLLLLLGSACGDSGGEVANTEDETRRTVTTEPTLGPTVEAAVEEIFWIAVDAAGIDRSVGFEDARFLLEEALFTSYDSRLTEIEGFGIDVFADWPFCINANAGAFAISSLGLAESPLDAAPYTNEAIEVIQSLDNDVAAARGGGRSALSPSESKRRCDDFLAELRETYGPVE